MLFRSLVDAYGPGNSRASSGGETRVIRMGYGADELYTRWSQRSLDLWKELAAASGQKLFTTRRYSRSGRIASSPRATEGRS